MCSSCCCTLPARLTLGLLLLRPATCTLTARRPPTGASDGRCSPCRLLARAPSSPRQHGSSRRPAARASGARAAAARRAADAASGRWVRVQRLAGQPASERPSRQLRLSSYQPEGRPPSPPPSPPLPTLQLPPRLPPAPSTPPLPSGMAPRPAAATAGLRWATRRLACRGRASKKRRRTRGGAWWGCTSRVGEGGLVG